MSGLYLLICTESGKFFTAPPLVAIICYFTRKQAGDQVLACDWAMRVWCDWVQPIRFIWLNPSVHPSICSPTCLFSSPSIHQLVHWFIFNPCPCFFTCLATCPPAHPCTNHGPPACQSNHIIYLNTCQFTYLSTYSCTVGFSVSPSVCMSDCLSFYHLVSCAFVGLAVGLSTCLSILKVGMHNREAEMTVHLSPPENNNEHFY